MAVLDSSRPVVEIWRDEPDRLLGREALIVAGPQMPLPSHRIQSTTTFMSRLSTTTEPLIYPTDCSVG
jgi:hypothetical protein